MRIIARALAGCCLLLAAIGTALAQAPAWDASRQIALDNNGRPVPGAKVFFFDASTTTPRAVFQDSALSTPHPHPVVADGNGRWPRIYLPYGPYRERVTTAANVQLWDDDGILNPEPYDEQVATDPNALLNTGDVWWSPINAPRAGAVRLNGLTIGNAASGATERANADTQALFVFLWNALGNDQAPVSGGRGSTALADYNANKTLTLPDLRGSGPIGLSTMGATGSGRFTGVPFEHGNGNTPGAVAGANLHTLIEAELPEHSHAPGTLAADSAGAHTHGGGSLSAASHAHGPGNLSGSTSGVSSNHTHQYQRADVSTGAAYQGGTTGTAVGSINYSTQTTTAGSADHVHGFTVTAGTTAASGALAVSGATASAGAHGHDISGATATVGDDDPHNNVPRALLGTWYIRL